VKGKMIDSVQNVDAYFSVWLFISVNGNSCLVLVPQASLLLMQIVSYGQAALTLITAVSPLNILIQYGLTECVST
jgi:hypothetical protein